MDNKRSQVRGWGGGEFVLFLCTTKGSNHTRDNQHWPTVSDVKSCKEFYYV